MGRGAHSTVYFLWPCLQLLFPAWKRGTERVVAGKVSLLMTKQVEKACLEELVLKASWEEVVVSVLGY